MPLDARLVKPPMLPSVLLVSQVTTSLLVLEVVPVLSVLVPLPMLVLVVVPPRDSLPLPLPNGLPPSLPPVSSSLLLILPPSLKVPKVPPPVS